jgi:hypothetical protein
MDSDSKSEVQITTHSLRIYSTVGKITQFWLAKTSAIIFETALQFQKISAQRQPLLLLLLFKDI